MIRVTITREDGSGTEYYAETVTTPDTTGDGYGHKFAEVDLTNVLSVTHIPATKPATTDHPYTAVYGDTP